MAGGELSMKPTIDMPKPRNRIKRDGFAWINNNLCVYVWLHDQIPGNSLLLITWFWDSYLAYLLRIVEDAVPLICCRSCNVKIQATVTDVAQRINISEWSSKDLVDMGCEMNTRHQGWRDCASACRKVWGRWMEIKRQFSKTGDKIVKKE